MTTDLPKPSLLRRFAAACYDGFLLFAVLFAAASLYAYIGQKITGNVSQQYATGDVMHELPLIAEGWVYSSYLTIIIIIFYSIFWCFRGQTLGMQAWHLKVTSTSGEIMSIKQAVIRCVVGLLSFACFGIGMLWILVDKDKRSLYDRASGTEVLQLPKKKK